MTVMEARPRHLESVSEPTLNQRRRKRPSSKLPLWREFRCIALPVAQADSPVPAREQW